MITRNARAAARGMTIIESMIALVVLAIGLLGLASIQILSVRSNYFGRQMAVASELASDLSENVMRWDYNDARLAVQSNVTSTTAAAITARWDLGRADAVPSSALPSFGEMPGDTNCTTPNALGATYTGVSGDVNGDGKYAFRRYWTVYGIDLLNLGTPQGKLVQIIVRWKEPGLGWRQVTSSTYRPNPAAGSL